MDAKREGRPGGNYVCAFAGRCRATIRGRYLLPSSWFSETSFSSGPCIPRLFAGFRTLGWPGRLARGRTTMVIPWRKTGRDGIVIEAFRSFAHHAASDEPLQRAQGE